VSAFPLLSTKLNLPARRPTLVDRPRLLQKLDLGLQPGIRLTLLSAPAGFGKTTLVADWQSALAQRGIPLTWFSVDAGDNDLVRFMRYFIAALQKVQPGLGQAALAVLDLPQLPQVESLMVLLINDIEAAPGEFVFVLDDYQVITDLSVQEAVNYLVDHMPGSLHLVLTTRTDPLLPLPRLRARAEVNEIRSADLRFTSEEAFEFVRQASRLALTPDQIAALDQSTEGWAAGLQIAAIALQALTTRSAGSPGIDAFLASFGGTYQYVFDYLAQEVLKQQQPEVIDFLYQTSILERLNPGLCDALTGRSDSARILRLLNQSNLFILPLDVRRQEYRYHRLFADFLRAGLDPDRLAELNRRASGWCAQNGLAEEAIAYALAASDWPAATALIKQVITTNFKSGEMLTFNRWLDALPASILHANADLCVCKGWISILQNNIGTSLSMVEWAEKAIEAGGQTASRGRMLGLKAQLNWGLGNLEEAFRLTEEAVSLIAPADGFFRTMALNLLGQMSRVHRSVTKSIAAFEEAIQSTQRQGNWETGQVDIGLAILRSNLIISYMEHGEVQRADTLCRESIRQLEGPDGQVHPAALFIYIVWSSLCYQVNALEDARRYVLKGFELCRKMGTTPTVIGGPTIYAALQLLEGDAQAALATVRDYANDARRMHLPWVAGAAAAVEAYINMAIGNLASAEAWAASANLPPLDQIDPIRTSEQLAHARLLIIQKKYANAYTLLANMGARAEQNESFQHLLEIDILLGQVMNGMGRHEEALGFIEKAVRLAAPSGSVRFFLDNDAADLVAALRERLHDSPEKELIAFLDRVLSLPTLSQTVRGLPASVSPLVVTARSISRPGLAEPITPRELEVLELMAQGLQNAEIARRLYLTVNTLKAHTNSIYGKLDVHSRMQAVNRARELGILTEKQN